MGRHRVKATETSFAIIETLVTKQEASLSELTEAVETPQTTVYDHLETLCDLGYVRKDDGTYRPTLQFLKLGGHVRFDQDLYHVARPKLRQITEETGEPATLAVEEDDYAVFVYSTEGEYTTRSTQADGSHTWLHTNALGKVFLAYADRERVDQLIDDYGLPSNTEHTITDQNELHRELASIREQGYALDREEGKLSMQGVAKPIFSPSNDVIAAVSVYSSTRRMRNEEFLEQVLRPLERAVDVIEVDIAHGV
ncbi:IclR family transcriptional regulator [Salinadaptatus halalkaliphilus]|nr:IclR family transcriptional regulator [Salinadaptatus halalkaliphilus]